MPLKWERGFSSRGNRSHASFPGVSYGPQPPWDLSTLLPNHHCFRTSSSTTLVHCSMHESHRPVYSVPRGVNGAMVGQQQEVPMRETTLDPSFPRFIFSPSQCHTAAVLSSTQVHGGSLGPRLLTHFSRLTLLCMKSQTRSQIKQHKDLNQKKLCIKEVLFLNEITR